MFILRRVMIMGILSGVFKSRDKPQNATSGSAYRSFIGGSSSGKNQFLMNFLYDTGARIQEALDVKSRDLRNDKTPTVTLHEKGCAVRCVMIRRGCVFKSMLSWQGKSARMCRRAYIRICGDIPGLCIYINMKWI